MIDSTTYKCCSKCKNEFPATSDFFFRLKASKDGLRPECKPCHFDRKKRGMAYDSIPDGYKRCSRCNQVRRTTEYHKCKYGKDGLKSSCKECHAEMSHEQWLKNPRMKTVERRPRKPLFDPYNGAPPGKRYCQYCKLYLPATNKCFAKDCKTVDGLCNMCKGCKRKYDIKYRKENAEALKERGKLFRLENADRLNQSRKERYWADPEKARADKRRSYHANPEPYNNWAKRNIDKVRLTRKRRRSRKSGLEFDFTVQDERRMLEYWDYSCCICGQKAGFWHMIAKDHWIPVADRSPDNPGTVAWNLLPMCHTKKDGEGGCNNSKSKRDPVIWLTEKLGKRKAKIKLAEIEAYFKWVKKQRA